MYIKPFHNNNNTNYNYYTFLYIQLLWQELKSQMLFYVMHYIKYKYYTKHKIY